MYKILFDTNVLAAARSLHVDFLVTSDQKLALHSPVAALTPIAMARLLDAETHATTSD